MWKLANISKEMNLISKMSTLPKNKNVSYRTTLVVFLCHFVWTLFSWQSYICYIPWLTLVVLCSRIMRFQIIFWYISKLFPEWKQHISFANFCGVSSFSAINFTIMKVFVLQFSSRNFSTFYLVFIKMNNSSMESQEIYMQMT